MVYQCTARLNVLKEAQEFVSMTTLACLGHSGASYLIN